MSNERDELAGVIHDSLYPGAYREDRMTWPQGIFVEADAILAAGYKKPRTITTAEELDALPVGSVILDPIGLSLHKNEFTGWRASNGAKDITAEMLQREALPATVLYTPEES